MNKLNLKLAIAGTAVFVLLLFAPSFQQALEVSTSSLRWVFNKPITPAGEMNRLASQARVDHDAQALAFAALHLPPGPASVRLADEAVQLDPKLT